MLIFAEGMVFLGTTASYGIFLSQIILFRKIYVVVVVEIRASGDIMIQNDT